MARARTTSAPQREGRREARNGESPRRQELLRIAAEVFAEKGYRGTTVRDIADRADILSGSLFYHFKTKDSIAEELIRPVFEELVKETREAVKTAGAADAKIAVLLRDYVANLEGNLLAMRILQSDWKYFAGLFPFLVKGLAEINRGWMKVLRQGIDEGVIRDDIEIHVLLQMIRGALTDIIRWYDPKGPASLSDIAEASVRIILDGIRAR